MIKIPFKENFKVWLIDFINLLLPSRFVKLTENYWTALHLKRLILSSYKPGKLVNKVGFLIWNRTTIDHIRGIIPHMPIGTFDFILANSVNIFDIFKLGWRKKWNLNKERIRNTLTLDFLKENLKNHLKEKECSIHTMNSIFRKKLQYRWIVCLNPDLALKYRKTYGIQLLGRNLVRMMFMLGVNNWAFDRAANSMFDTIFCGGEWQKERYDSLGIKAEVIASGSPRFDRKSDGIDREKFFENYNLDKNKKTILWLPTHGKFTSVVNFLEVMQDITKGYNVVLKPHSYCYLEINKLDDLARNTAPDVVFNVEVNNYDSSQLISIADYVFCDYGGSVFTAICRDKNVLLLNADNDRRVSKLLGKDSPELEIRKEIVNFYKHEKERLINTLNDENVWEEQKVIRKRIRERFFTTPSEPSGKIIADILVKKLQEASA